MLLSQLRLLSQRATDCTAPTGQKCISHHLQAGSTAQCGQTADFRCPHVVERKHEIALGFFFKGTNPVPEGSMLMASDAPKAPSS